MFIEESVLKEKIEERNNPRARLGLDQARKSRGAAVLSATSNESETRNNISKFIWFVIFYQLYSNTAQTSEKVKSVKLRNGTQVASEGSKDVSHVKKTKVTLESDQ